MGWSLPIARIAGTEVKIHVTFLLLLIWIWIMHYQTGGSGAAWQGVTFILAVFLCVLLHEFGHVLAARQFGIRTPDITLLPIGGLARLERMPDKPAQELVVAIAGPLVNVVIAAVLLAYSGGPAALFIERICAFDPNRRWSSPGAGSVTGYHGAEETIMR